MLYPTCTRNTIMPGPSIVNKLISGRFHPVHPPLLGIAIILRGRLINKIEINGPQLRSRGLFASTVIAMIIGQCLFIGSMVRLCRAMSWWGWSSRWRLWCTYRVGDKQCCNDYFWPLAHCCVSPQTTCIAIIIAMFIYQQSHVLSEHIYIWYLYNWMADLWPAFEQ